MLEGEGRRRPEFAVISARRTGGGSRPRQLLASCDPSSLFCLRCVAELRESSAELGKRRFPQSQRRSSAEDKRRFGESRRRNGEVWFNLDAEISFWFRVLTSSEPCRSRSGDGSEKKKRSEPKR